MLNTYIIGLGSNINPHDSIACAKAALAKRFKILAESTFIVTKPIGFKSENDFVNGAIRIETNLNPDELRNELKTIEKECGRTPESHHFHSRTIDLDILVMNDDVIDQDFYERDFIRASVLEISPTVKYFPKKS